MTEVIAKPLGKITALLADCGLEVTYAYDDLVFVQHSAFLLQFTAAPKSLKMFINTECDPATAADVQKQMLEAHAQSGFSLVPAGYFTISENNNETIDLKFS